MSILIWMLITLFIFNLRLSPCVFLQMRKSFTKSLRTPRSSCRSSPKVLIVYYFYLVLTLVFTLAAFRTMVKNSLPSGGSFHISKLAAFQVDSAVIEYTEHQLVEEVIRRGRLVILRWNINTNIKIVKVVKVFRW